MFLIKFINLVYIDFAQNKKTKIFIFKNESSRILSQDCLPVLQFIFKNISKILHNNQLFYYS